jgi:hypothetical protein
MGLTMDGTKITIATAFKRIAFFSFSFSINRPEPQQTLKKIAVQLQRFKTALTFSDLPFIS